jgi:hypothetical protein|tara:strand:+ start:6519 stop:6818 length:300 start_codon:yes stop_codon:yes gene_type:complete
MKPFKSHQPKHQPPRTAGTVVGAPTPISASQLAEAAWEKRVSAAVAAQTPPRKTDQTGAKADAKTDTKTGKQADEIGGPQGLEPTRYGDWERNGICYDF